MGVSEEDGLGDLGAELDVHSSAFDVAAFINKRFPDEAALSAGVDPFLLKLRDAIARIDNQLDELVRAHRHSGEQAAKSVDASLASLAALNDTLETLTAAAARAEDAARDALAPARPYSVALANSATTASVLEALVVLSDAVLQLETAADSASLERVARAPDLYPSLHRALRTFETANRGELAAGDAPTLKRFAELKTRAKAANESLRKTILAEFRRLSDTVSLSSAGDDVPSVRLQEAVDRLCTACGVAAAMGPEVRGDVIGMHVRSRMLAFRAAFELDKTGLTSIEPRFGWIRRELRANWAALGGEMSNRGWALVFPDDWDVPRRLVFAAMREVRTWVSDLLSTGAEKDVIGLISALKSAKEFEQELDKRFLRAVRLPKVPGPDNALPSGVTTSEAIGTTSPSFVSTLSSCFGPYMGSYVNQEDEHLKILFADLVKTESWTCTEGNVLKSSTEFFLAIKKSMRTCASLDSRQPLFLLYKVFRKHLGGYASVLMGHIPAPVPSDQAGSTDSVIRVVRRIPSESASNAEFNKRVHRACSIVVTADYCAKTSEQLEESLKQAVESIYAPEVTLEPERGRFVTASARGVRAVVALVCGELESSLLAMRTENWSTCPAVGDASQYVEDAGETLERIMPTIAARLSKPQMRFFLQRFAAGFVPQYVENLYACQGMNHTGAQQLLLDAATLKQHLLRVPSLSHMPAPVTFSTYVNREMGRGEAVLKVVLASKDTSVDAYITLIPDGSAADLQRILELKGLRRAESAPLLLKYTRQAGPQRGLNPVGAEDGESEDMGNLGGASDWNSDAYLPDNRMDADASSSLPQLKQDNSDASSGSGAGNAASRSAETGVESMRALFRGWESPWGSFKDAGIADRLGQTADRINESLESTAEQVKRRFGKPSGQ